MRDDSTPSSRVAQRYAEIFVSLFERIISDPSSPLVREGCFPQQNIDGVPYRGSNAMLTAMVSAQRGFGIPVWMTRTRKEELGLSIYTGERSIPIVHYDHYYEDTHTGHRDPTMTDDLYKALSAEEKERWICRCFMRSYPEFNICQTDFAEVYPDQWKELQSVFGPATRNNVSCDIVDNAISSGTVFCPVHIDDTYERFTYVERSDYIEAPSKGIYADQARYYSDLFYILARATGSEGRLDRDLGTFDMGKIAGEELISELAGATLSTLAGVRSTIQDTNLAHLKSWVSLIGNDPEIIYRVVNQASAAADLVSSSLGLELRRGFDVQKMMSGIEAAQDARRLALEKRERRAAQVRSTHRSGWSPVKAGRQGPGQSRF